MYALLIHARFSCGTARAADLKQIKFLDLLFAFWKGKNLAGAAKSLNFASSSLQVEAKHKFSRRKKRGKKSALDSMREA